MTDYIRDLRGAKWGSGVTLQGGNPDQLMSALGQKQTSDWRPLMSALHPKADIRLRDLHVRFVPIRDIAGCQSVFCQRGTTSTNVGLALDSIAVTRCRLGSTVETLAPKRAA